MKIKLLLIFLTVLSSSCSNSNDKNREIEAHLKEKAIKELKIKQEHGYYVSWFIQGRIKSTIIFEGIPFEMKVFRINSELLQKKLNFKIIDSTIYNIHYIDGNDDVFLRGIFGEKLDATQLELIVSKSSIINTKTLEPIKSIDYLFEVESY